MVISIITKNKKFCLVKLLDTKNVDDDAATNNQIAINLPEVRLYGNNH